jgi:signal transduction histidine kinase
MRPSLSWKPLLIFSLLLSGIYTRAQRPALLKRHLAELQQQYQDHGLRDTVYLKAADSAAALLLQDDSLPQLLSVYQQVAFGDKGLGRYRANYYTYLAIYSYNKNRLGSAVYYSEKNNEERIKAGIFQKEGLPHSDMFAITVYFNNKDYARVFSKYSHLRPALLQLSEDISSWRGTPEDAFVAFGILNAVVDASYKTGDTTLANEGIGICEKMLEGIARQPVKYKSEATFYHYIYHTLRFEKEKYLDHSDKAGDFLQTAIREVRSGSFPAHLQPDYTEDIYEEAFDFYFDHHKKDSARHYLGLIRSMHDSLVKFSSMQQSFLQESNSKLLAGNGHYEAAYQDLLKVHRKSDSAYYAVSADKDNNLYALAEAENARNELLRSESKQRQAERFNIFLFFTLTLLVFGGLTGFLVYRSAQQRRLLNLRLGMARNFHDEIGPMLLYANILVKKEGETNPSANLEELKGQMSNIMEGVRGISHDLKSSELSTVGLFYKEIVNLLDKLKASAQIDFTAALQGGSRVLSHWQYDNLRKIVNELISNSVKHAACSLIAIRVVTQEQVLRINFSDNGKGMAPRPERAGIVSPDRQGTGIGSPERQGAGIGMQNVEERVGLLKGEFQLHNTYPEGYSIDISIPLL